MGGLARKATILDEISEKYSNAFIVDAGNLFFSNETLEPGIPGEKSVINVDIIIESLNIMGLTAFSPGVKDFSAGNDFLLSAVAKSQFPYISANIYDLNNDLLFDPYIIREKNGLKIAFIGLSSVFSTEGIIVKDPLESLQNVLYEVESKSDLNILLFSSTNKEIDELKNKDFDLTLIIRSLNKDRSFDGGGFEIPIFSIGDKGKFLYEFDLKTNVLSYPYVDVGWCYKTIKKAKKSLNNMKKGNMLIDLQAIFKDDPATLKRIFAHESAIENANNKLENAINTITYNRISVGRLIEGRIDILQVVDKGKLRIKEITSPLIEIN